MWFVKSYKMRGVRLWNMMWSVGVVGGISWLSLKRVRRDGGRMGERGMGGEGMESDKWGCERGMEDG